MAFDKNDPLVGLPIPDRDDPLVERKDWPAFFLKEFGVSPWSVKTFQKFGTTGGGPRYVVIGGSACSRPSWLRPWFGSKMSAPRTSTSEAA